MEKRNYVSPEIERYNNTADVICTSTIDSFGKDDFENCIGGN